MRDILNVLRYLWLALFCSVVVRCENQTYARRNQTEDILQYVDPLVGTSAGGHVFPGATLPFGMAKAVADVMGENQGGFSSDGGDINGFSHMHDSGTGGSPSMGNFPIWPQIGCPGDDVNRCDLAKDFRRLGSVNGSVKATPGYFSVQLYNLIVAEMTVSNRTALYKFTFPNTSYTPDIVNLSPLITVDLTDLPNTRKEGGISVDEKTGRTTGNGTFNASFGIGSYQSFFCMDFSGAKIRDNGVWIHNRAGTQPKTLRVVPDGVNGNNSPPLPAGAFIRFQGGLNGTTILIRVGLSFISSAQACQNAEREIPDFNFDKTLATAVAAWKEKLSVVQVDNTGVNKDLQTTFWSGIYRSMISPQDYTGENPLWKSNEPYYDSYYCIWDSYRSIHQLLTLVDPHSQALMVRSLLDIYVHEGWLPDCRMSLCKGFTQGGSNADTLIVDSWMKGITDGIDWDLAYKAIVKDAEVEPQNWGVEGRGGLTSWKTLGYIPVNDFDPYGSGAFTRSISRTVEYAYNDFCISQMAKGLGHTADYEKYKQRSGNWKNLFNPTQSSLISGRDTGFVGFLQPKTLNGTFDYQDPIVCSNELEMDGCYLNANGLETYEGNPWLYTLYVPGDMANLITTLGGPDAFVRRLHYYHETKIAYIGDEQAFLNVFLYHYAGRPALSSARAHAYIPAKFKATLDGLPGNDDSGAMGSFAAMTMMGIFPNAGQNVYFITPPFFPSFSITSRVTGKTATVRNVNFDPAYRNIYIQSATLNGKEYTRNWINHDFFLKGGVLELTLGPMESAWGTRVEDLPPSLSTSGFANRTTVTRPHVRREFEAHGGGGPFEPRWAV